MTLTIIYLTANRLPAEWLRYQSGLLEAAAGGAPILRITRQRIPGFTDLLDEDPPGYVNIYRQMLRGAKLAGTPHVAVAEDDVLYHPYHFLHRPRTVSYNMHRWALFTWGEPMYSMRDRVSNCALTADRLYLIDALEERFAKYPDGNMPPQHVGEVGREKVEKGLGVTPRKAELWYSDIGIVQINHALATEDRQRRRRKRYGKVKAYDIPHWGKASGIVRRFTICANKESASNYLAEQPFSSM